MRYFYLDNLRSLLMILGLVLHTCAAFSPSKYWLVSYLYPIEWTDSVNEVIHLFRMPLFFMISGFFAFMMMEKQNFKKFCSVKILRIALPFLSVLVLINLPQYLYLDFLLASPDSYKINSNELIGHLWFLINLLTYFLIYSLLHTYINFLHKTIKNLPPIVPLSAFFLIIPLGYLGLLALNKVGIPIYDNIPGVGSFHKLFAYFDYFLIGCLIGGLKHQVFLSTMFSLKGILLLSTLFVISMAPWWAHDVLNNVTTPYVLHIQAILVAIVIWLCAVLGLNRNSGFTNYLAEASYSIYLFHHAIIVALVLFSNYVVSVYKIEIDSYLVFILVISISTIMTLIIHQFLVRSNNVLAILFSGKKLYKV